VIVILFNGNFVYSAYDIQELYSVQGYQLEEFGQLCQDFRQPVSYWHPNNQNPANLARYTNTSISIAYQYNVEDDGGFYRPGPRIDPYLPQSLAFITSTAKLAWGVSYSQRFNSGYSIQQTTPLHPDDGPIVEYGARVDSYATHLGYHYFLDQEMWHSISIGAAYKYERLLLDTHWFSGSATAASWSIGGAIEIGTDRPSAIILGAYFEKSTAFRKEFADTLWVHGSDGPVPGPITRYQLQAQLPESFHLDLEYQLTSKLTLKYSVHHILWGKSIYFGEHQYEYSGSAKYRLSAISLLAIGFSSSGFEWSQPGDELGWEENTNAVFLLAGYSRQIGPIRINFSIADAHWTGGEWREQTICELGVAYQVH
jgi:hypothetical protein